MKRTLLLATLFISGATFAQFTQDNEPAIGDNDMYYLVDSNAVDYAGMTGANAMWDYSATPGVFVGGNQVVKALNIVTPASTPDGDSFTNATKAVEIEGFMTSYFSSTGTTRNSRGFTFDSYVITFDDELLMNYPFGLGASLSDAFTGNASVMGQNVALNGTITATADATGTLKLSNATTVNNVTRYKIVEQASGNTFIGMVSLARTQYEYYDLANSSLPLFIHSVVTITIGNSAQTERYVMSTVPADGALSLDDNTLSGVAVYPNPASGTLFVSGLENDATLSLTDAQGKTISTFEAAAGIASMNISEAKAGVYMLTIATAKGSKVERVVIR